MRLEQLWGYGYEASSSIVGYRVYVLELGLGQAGREQHFYAAKCKRNRGWFNHNELIYDGASDL